MRKVLNVRESVQWTTVIEWGQDGACEAWNAEVEPQNQLAWSNHLHWDATESSD